MEEKSDKKKKRYCYISFKENSKIIQEYFTNIVYGNDVTKIDGLFFITFFPFYF